MSFIDRLFNKGKEVVNIDSPREKKAVDYPEYIQKYRTREDIRKLENAIDLSENLTNYNREDMHRIYRRILDDPMLTSQWDTRKLKTLDKEFKVFKGDKEHPELTELLEAGWFIDYLDAMLDSKMWGFTLVEFGGIEDDKFTKWRDEETGLYYDAVVVIDRDFVKPEKGIIVKRAGDFEGLDITDEGVSDWLIMEGSSFNAGLLRKIARYALFKDNVLGNWSEWAEVFGMDYRVGKTDAQNDARKKFGKALRDLGSNGVGIFNIDDEVDFVGTKRTDAYKVYMEFATYIDSQLAKLIFGQDVVSNNTGQVVGKVGEGISNLYGDVDAKFIQRNVNDKLFPLMINLGWKQLKDARFEWDTTESISLQERSEVDLKVSQMGFQLEPEYITDTYGTSLFIPPVDEGTNPEQAKAQAQLKGSVGGIQGIIQMQQSVAQGFTTPESAIATLIEIYGIEKSTATAIIGKTKPIKESKKPIENINKAIKDFYGDNV